MRNERSRAALEAYYDAAAQKYLDKLKPTDFAETTSEATQRQITLASFAMIRARRPEIQYFNNMLVQYPPTGRKRNPGQVVPDNTIIVYPQPVRPALHYSLPLQPVLPFLVVDYVCESNERKTDADNRRKYEEDLRIPYYLCIHPEAGKLSLFGHDGTSYAPVLPDAAGLHAIPELGMAVSLVGGHARYWSRGEMLPLLHELYRQVRRAEEEAARVREDRERACPQTELQFLRDTSGKAS